MSSSPSPNSSNLFLLSLSSFFLLLLLSLFLHRHPAVAFAPDSAPPPPPSPPSNGSTVYDLLPQFGLPPGLLPDTVKSYSLADNGTFTVDLYGACYVNFEYLVYYAPHITGVLRYGGAESLKGIQVRRFLVWFDVDAIKVDLPPTDSIYFQLGWITRKLSVDQFQTVHSCREKGAADIRTLPLITDGGDSGAVQL